MLDQYCTECHSDAERAGELSLEHITPAAVAANPETWEHVVRRLRGERDAAARGKASETRAGRNSSRHSRRSLDAAANAKGVSPGSVVMHRLNRVEYPTAIRDLLGVDIDASRLLPADVTSDGFDNVAQVLRVSPTYLDQYIAAAREISIKAVGNPARCARARRVPRRKRRITPCPSRVCRSALATGRRRALLSGGR